MLDWWFRSCLPWQKHCKICEGRDTLCPYLLTRAVRKIYTDSSRRQREEDQMKERVEWGSNKKQSALAAPPVMFDAQLWGATAAAAARHGAPPRLRAHPGHLLGVRSAGAVPLAVPRRLLYEIYILRHVPDAGRPRDGVEAAGPPTLAAASFSVLINSDSTKQLIQAPQWRHCRRYAYA